MRLFVALNLEPELRARIWNEIIEPLRAELPLVRWVREETLHVTLAFLGERTDAEAAESERVVREVAATRPPFEVTLRGLGVFPSADRPRVVWLGLADASTVRALHRSLERERARLGLAAEGRAYHPHVTLGRVPKHAEGAVHAPLARLLPTMEFEATVTLHSVDLMKSELTPTGSRYTRLAEASLGNGTR